MAFNALNVMSLDNLLGGIAPSRDIASIDIHKSLSSNLESSFSTEKEDLSNHNKMALEESKLDETIKSKEEEIKRIGKEEEEKEAIDFI